MPPDFATNMADGRPRRPVAVVTDTATSLPLDMLADNGIHAASMEITIDGETFPDGPGGGLADFYERLRNARRVPTTSAPKPAAWLAVFKSAAADANSIFCVTLSAQMSAAYDAARVASEIAGRELPGVEIRVFDSAAAAGSQALLVLECARMARQGSSLDEIEQRAADVSKRLRLLAYLDTLEYIHRSGRVPRIAVWAANLFNIKPVMEYSAGKVGAIARPRSRGKAFKRILAEALKDLSGGRAHVNVMHADAEHEAKELMRQIGERVDCSELFLTQFHPFMGAHTGPGLVGVSYWAES